MTTLLQGAIIGGTAAYLCRDTKQAAEQRAPQTWARVALQANHVLLVLGAVFEQACVQPSWHTYTFNAALVITPFVVLVGLLAKQRGIGAKEADVATKCSPVYRIATAVCSVALLALGNYAGGLAALSMLALGWAQEQKMFSSTGETAWRFLSAGTAIAGGLGFAAWIAAEGTVLSQTALIATTVLSVISWASAARTPQLQNRPQNDLPPAPPASSAVSATPDHPEPLILPQNIQPSAPPAPSAASATPAHPQPLILPQNVPPSAPPASSAVSATPDHPEPLILPQNIQPSVPPALGTPPGGPDHGDATIPLDTNSPAPPAQQQMPAPSAPPKPASNQSPLPPGIPPLPENSQPPVSLPTVPPPPYDEESPALIPPSISNQAPQPAAPQKPPSKPQPSSSSAASFAAHRSFPSRAAVIHSSSQPKNSAAPEAPPQLENPRLFIPLPTVLPLPPQNPPYFSPLIQPPIFNPPPQPVALQNLHSLSTQESSSAARNFPPHHSHTFRPVMIHPSSWQPKTPPAAASSSSRPKTSPAAASASSQPKTSPAPASASSQPKAPPVPSSRPSTLSWFASALSPRPNVLLKK